MRLWIPTITFLVIAMMLGAEYSALGQEAFKYKTEKKLRAACEGLLKPAEPRAPKAPFRETDAERQFLVAYLGAEDPELRDAAADILGKLLYYRRGIRAFPFEKYLSDDYPMNVRVIALAYCIHNWRGGRFQESWDKNKARWSHLLNEIAEQREAPPHLLALIVGIGPNDAERRIALLKEQNKPIMLQRFLGLLTVGDDKVKGNREAQYKREMLWVIWAFPKEMVLTESLTWYKQEKSADARRALVDFVAWRTGSDHQLASQFKPLFELAAKDEDKGISETAKARLARIEK